MIVWVFPEKVAVLQEEAKISGLVNIYICNDKGELLLPNGNTIPISDGEYYKTSMKGKQFVTEPFKDRLGNFPITLTVPIYDKNQKINRAKKRSRAVK